MTPSDFHNYLYVVCEFWNESGNPSISGSTNPDRYDSMCDAVIALVSDPTSGKGSVSFAQAKEYATELKAFLALVG